jgi:hypothetical protein
MLASSFSFLTPWAGLLVVVAAVPLLALAYAQRRVARVRVALRLPEPQERPFIARAFLLFAVVVLLVLAATQPVLQSRSALHARTDAQVFAVLDTSRSMLAAPSPGGTARLARAKAIAERVDAELGNVPVGVATFTDRVIPDLFPTADGAAVEGVLRSVQIDDPPPREVSTVATTFAALSNLATQGFFADSIHKRAVLLLTDGESGPFDAGAVAAAFSRAGIALVIDRVGGGGDRVWRPNGTPEANYRPDPAGARASVTQLASAVQEPVTSDPTAALRRALGAGPTRAVGQTTRTRTLAPYLALLALLPLVCVFMNGALVKVFAWRNIALRMVPRSRRVE